MPKRPIGVFDSGLGGVFVTKKLKEAFPNENFIYIADLKNLPYGTKSKEEIKSYVNNIINYLLKQNVKAIVIACNTASTEAFDILIDIPLINMIESTLKEVFSNDINNNVLLIGTQKTIDSKVYEGPLKDKGVILFKKPIPRFVMLVEDLELNTTKSKKVVNEELAEFKDKNINTIILGCTHFGFLSDEISNVLKGKTINGVKGIISNLNKVVDPNNRSSGYLYLYTTKDLIGFKNRVDYLNIKYDKIKLINL